MSAATWLAFALGAGIGAPVRFLVDDAVDRGGDTWSRGTLVVNAVGSLMVGVVTALTLRDGVSDDIAVVIGTGFCGALTTFSTFAVQTVRLVADGEVEAALRNVVYNTSVSIGLAALGYAAILRVT